jgi:hypothetical protein
VALEFDRAEGNGRPDQRIAVGLLLRNEQQGTDPVRVSRHCVSDARLGDGGSAERAQEMPQGSAEPPIRDARHATGRQRIGDTSRTVADFWEWAVAELVSNTNRSVFAEYLVGLALDATGSTRRVGSVGSHLSRPRCQGKGGRTSASVGTAQNGRRSLASTLPPR